MRRLLLLLLLLPLPLFAQTGAVTGVALDTVGNTVAGATVTVCPQGSLGIPCTPVTASTVSNGQGAFSVTVPTGTYTVTVFRSGVVATSSVIVVAPSNITVANNVTYAGSVNFTGNLTVSGTGTAGKWNGVCIVDGIANATLAAAATCAGTSGVIEIPMFAVPALTANVTIPAGVTLRFDGPSGITTTGFTLTVNGPISAPATQIFFGTGTVTITNGQPLFAIWFPGADCGAKVNAANAARAGGEIWVDTGCGLTTWSAVTLSAKQKLLFIQGGTYVHSGITFGQGASIVGEPCGDADSVSTCPVVLQSTTGLAAALVMSGNESICRDITLDGNNTGVLGANITGLRVELNHCHAWRFTSHGIKVASTTATNNSAAAVKIFSTMSIGNGGDGLFCSAATDGVIGAISQFDNNTNLGLEASDCSGWRVVQNDFGGNAAGGIKITGLSTFQGLGWTIDSNEFGINKGHDIFIDGNNAGVLAARDEVIVGNYFNGLGTGTAANTFSGIHIQNSAGNTVVGNTCRSASPQSYKYCIEITQPTLTEGTDIVVGNNIDATNPFGTGFVLPQATTMGFGNNDPANLSVAKFPSGYAVASSGLPIAGATSGTSTLQATAIAGTTVNTLPPVSGTIPAGVFNAAGTAQTGSVHIVQDTATLAAGTVTVTLSGNAVFTSATSYTCVAKDTTTPANAASCTQTSGSSITITGTATDVVRFILIGN